MFEVLSPVFSPNPYMPHGSCYLWQPSLMALHIVSDLLIALAYFSIPAMLVYFVRKRKVPFLDIFLLFGAFIVLCGAGHLLEIVTLWYPIYWISGVEQAITALVSCYTAIQLVHLLPQFLALRTPEELEKINHELEHQVEVSEAARAELESTERGLQRLVKGTASFTGAEFFQALTENISQALQVRHTFVAELTSPETIQTLAFWSDGQLRENFQYPIAETPCELAIQERKLQCFSQEVQEIFPQAGLVQTMQPECYLSVPLLDSQQQVIGVLSAISDRPLQQPETAQALIRIFAARAAAELQRQKAESALRRAYDELEIRVEEATEGLRQRTEELVKTNTYLEKEIQERTTAESALRATETRLRKQQSGLISLAKNKHLYEGNISSAVEEITQIAAQVLQVERSSLWLYVDEEQAIRCIDLYQQNTQSHSQGTILRAEDYPSYFHALEFDRLIAAPDAQNDPRTEEFSRNYLEPLGISSMLDAPIYSKGKLVGVIRLEQIGATRKWTLGEQNFVSYLAYMTALALESRERKQAEQALERQAAQDKLLSHISRCSLDSRLESATDYILKSVGEFTAADRAYICYYKEDTCQIIEAQEWCATGIKSRFGQSSQIKCLPWLQKQHSQGQPVEINDLSQLPPEAETEKGELQAKRILSLLSVPMVYRGKMVGFIGIEATKVPLAWTQEQTKLLQRIGEILAISHARFRAEQALQQKNQELATTLKELKTTQNELVLSEKMAALGQLIAGVAHEINTPLGAIRASSGNSATALEEFLAELPYLLSHLATQKQDDFFLLLERSFQADPHISSRERRKYKRSLTQELSSYNLEEPRQLADTLTDMGIYDDVEGFMELLKDPEVDRILHFAYNISRLRSNSHNIITAVERASKVVFALKNYARYDSSGEKQLVEVTEGIDTVLELYHNQLKRGVDVKRLYDEAPALWCYPDELIQVWTNLIHNAVQAMDGEGQLTVRVSKQEEQIVVEISDSGGGIPPEAQSRIFEPFFTTKPRGEGTGLGLDIVRKIVEKHEGGITVDSQPGRTTFTVCLPLDAQPVSIRQEQELKSR